MCKYWSYFFFLFFFPSSATRVQRFVQPPILLLLSDLLVLQVLNSIQVHHAIHISSHQHRSLRTKLQHGSWSSFPIGPCIFRRLSLYFYYRFIFIFKKVKNFDSTIVSNEAENTGSIWISLAIINPVHHQLILYFMTIRLIWPPIPELQSPVCRAGHDNIRMVRVASNLINRALVSSVNLCRFVVARAAFIYQSILSAGEVSGLLASGKIDTKPTRLSESVAAFFLFFLSCLWLGRSF